MVGDKIVVLTKPRLSVTVVRSAPALWFETPRCGLLEQYLLPRWPSVREMPVQAGIIRRNVNFLVWEPCREEGSSSPF